jgi:hypothetical protein
MADANPPLIDRPPQVKHLFAAAEDDLIRYLVEQQRMTKWSDVAAQLPGRTSRQVRDRYKHYLSPNVTAHDWKLDEDKQLIQLVGRYGQRWSSLVQYFPGRSEVQLRNRWNVLQRKAKKLGGPFSGTAFPVHLAAPMPPQAE